jgi:hypothetical protein
MATTFETVSLHYMVRLLKANYSAVLGAVKALGLRGRVQNGERVWTRAEFEQIKTRLSN